MAEPAVATTDWTNVNQGAQLPFKLPKVANALWSLSPVKWGMGAMRLAGKGNPVGALNSISPLGIAGQVADEGFPQTPDTPPNYTDSSQASAERNVGGLLGAIRAHGAVKEKAAYRTGLANAAERGVALGSDPGGISGLAQQEIMPRVSDVQAATETSVWDAINRERQNLELARQGELNRQAEKEAAKPKGIFGRLFG